jgi:hypothetical protein
MSGIFEWHKHCEALIVQCAPVPCQQFCFVSSSQVHLRGLRSDKNKGFELVFEWDKAHLWWGRCISSAPHQDAAPKGGHNIFLAPKMRGEITASSSLAERVFDQLDDASALHHV